MFRMLRMLSDVNYNHRVSRDWSKWRHCDVTDTWPIQHSSLSSGTICPEVIIIYLCYISMCQNSIHKNVLLFQTYNLLRSFKKRIKTYQNICILTNSHGALSDANWRKN